MHPKDPLSKHFRLSSSVQAALGRIGIRHIHDLLYHFPTRYDQAGAEAAIAGLAPGSEATIFGTIHNLETRRSWKRKIPVGEALLRDASGAIKIMWFHQPYLAKKFQEGMFVKASGFIGGSGTKLYLANPHVEVSDPAEQGLFAHTKEDGHTTQGLFAVYPETRGLSSLWFRHALERVFKAGGHELEDPLPTTTIEAFHLPPLPTALVWIHTPEKSAHAEAARKRFAFEEMLCIQTAQAQERANNSAHTSFPIEGSALTERFLSSLTFPPTRAQQRAIQDVISDFDRGTPMARLLEGDVGSGKTLVAAASAYAVVSSKPPKGERGALQVAYMAPTEILAAQHFESFTRYFKDLPISIGLLTGSGCKKFPSKTHKERATTISRAQLLKWTANGEIAMLVGTHALIQKSVVFKNLAYCIVDEQHRFGTKQRASLLKKQTVAESGRQSAGNANSDEACLSEASSAGRISISRTLPHFLSMTATPIPRTLALTIYGDLDLSVLDELPPGRVAIETTLIRPGQRERAYERMRAELQKGRQAYVICPRIEEPDPARENALQAKSAKAEAARLKKEVFPEYEIGLLHGAMKPNEKDNAMRAFERGETHILVATSVVEVGVNVPNATVILIEGAERFGLSQLHQLRGRVQRSSHQPHCFLVPEKTGTIALQRLRALETSSDGFALAEADLKARGAGDLWGRKQWGISDLGMEALKNPKLIAAARREAQAIIEQDPSLASHPALAARVLLLNEGLHAE